MQEPHISPFLSHCYGGEIPEHNRLVELSRGSQDGVTHIQIPGKPSYWLIHSVDKVKALSRLDFCLSTMHGNKFPPQQDDHFRLNVVTRLDGEAHAKSRQPLMKTIHAMLPMLLGTFDAHIDALTHSLKRNEEIDLVQSPLTCIAGEIVCELAGIPEPDRAQLIQLHSSIDPPWRPLDTGINGEAFAEFHNYLQLLISTARSGSLKRSQNFLSTIVESEALQALTHEEAVRYIRLLFEAGIETLTALFIGAVVLVADNPQSSIQTINSPANRPKLADYILRQISPIQVIMRTTTREIRLGKHVIPENQRLAISLAAANMNCSDRPAAIPDLDSCERNQPNFAFGFGSHTCVGAKLSKALLDKFLAWQANHMPRVRLTQPIELCGCLDAVRFRKACVRFSS